MYARQELVFSLMYVILPYTEPSCAVSSTAELAAPWYPITSPTQIETGMMPDLDEKAATDGGAVLPRSSRRVMLSLLPGRSTPIRWGRPPSRRVLMITVLIAGIRPKGQVAAVAIGTKRHCGASH